MTSIFDDVRLPIYVEQGAQGGPVFNTTITTLGSGNEQRNQNWIYPRHSWDVGYGMFDMSADNNAETLQDIRAFFFNRRGRARAFRFRDYSDYTAVDTEVPTGGLTGACQVPLVKTYADSAGNKFYRPITRLDGAITFKVDGTGISFALVNLGLITFTSLPAGALTATFNFDVPVRFDTDSFNMTLENVIAGSVPSLPVVECLESAYTLNGLPIPS